LTTVQQRTCDFEKNGNPQGLWLERHFHQWETGSGNRPCLSESGKHAYAAVLNSAGELCFRVGQSVVQVAFQCPDCEAFNGQAGAVQKRTLSCAGCNWTRWFPRGLTGETALPGLQERGRLAAEGLPAEFGLTCPREWYDLLSRD